MMNSSGSSEPIKCGFCSRVNECMENPVVLSCNHIHCRDCLTVLYQSMDCVRCPTCRNICDVPLDNLPSSISGRHTSWCLFCKKEGLEEAAVTYCCSCYKSYCEKHLTERNSDMCPEDAKLLTIDQYKKSSKRIKPRTCPTHQDTYGRGCRCCLDVYCSQCCHDLRTEHEYHEGFVELNTLADELAVKTRKLSDGLAERREQFKIFHVQTTQSIAEHERCTEEMMNMICHTEAEQLNAIMSGYTRLKNEFKERREESKACLQRFLSDTVADRWFDLNVTQQSVDSHLTFDHQVDLITEHESIKDQIASLLNQQMPSLPVCSPEVKVKGRNRDIEIEWSDRTCTVSLNEPYSGPRGETYSESSDEDTFHDAESETEKMESIKMAIPDPKPTADAINNEFKDNSKKIKSRKPDQKKHRKKKK